MGDLRFRFNPPDLVSRVPGLRKAYITGLDRTPGRCTVEVRPGQLICHRESPESGRLHVSWPVEGFGTPILGTATLSERLEPYDLAVELARGRLNDVRNQVADWELMGLKFSAKLGELLGESQRAFARAATSRDDVAASSEASQASLTASCRAAAVLLDDYTAHVLQKRKEFQSPLPTSLGVALAGEPKKQAWATEVLSSFNMARISCAWGRVAPTEGRYRWEEADAQIAWCRASRLTPTAGPLIDLRAGALPDWLWLWEGDFEEIQSMALDVVRHAVGRYRGKIAAWHIVQRVGSGEILGLSEEEQIRLTARVLQVARQTDPKAQFIVDFDRPWAEWLSTSTFQLGPLHLADSLARADLGLSGIGLEIAPGYGGLGSQMRDLFDFSRLLDMYALINLPLHVTLVFPSADGTDPQADPTARVDTAQWPSPPDEVLQDQWARRWAALAIAKPFVRSVTWAQSLDSAPHLFAHGGLFRPDDKPKPALASLRSLREAWLA